MNATGDEWATVENGVVADATQMFKWAVGNSYRALKLWSQKQGLRRDIYIMKYKGEKK